MITRTKGEDFPAERGRRRRLQGCLASMVSEPPNTGIQNSAAECTSGRGDGDGGNLPEFTSERAPSRDRRTGDRRRPTEESNGAVNERTQSGIPARILVAGSDLLAGALANALEIYGFATRHIPPQEQETRRGIEWHPNLVILDLRSLDIAAGTALIDQLSRAQLLVCVIDVAGETCRLNAWMGAGSSAVVDGGEPFDQLFRTINQLLRKGPSDPVAPAWSPPLEKKTKVTQEPRDRSLGNFAILTERERIVLAELIEGHCAEEIATAGFVSISTVRSQIKAILQKLGVNSQLAAVALARRADWSLDAGTGTHARPGYRRTGTL